MSKRLTGRKIESWAKGTSNPSLHGILNICYCGESKQEFAIFPYVNVALYVAATPRRRRLLGTRQHVLMFASSLWSMSALPSQELDHWPPSLPPQVNVHQVKWFQQMTPRLESFMHTRVANNWNMSNHNHFYQTRVRSLGMLVSNWLTHWLTD